MAHNMAIDLIDTKDYKSAAEWIIKIHMPDVFMSWGRPQKEKIRKRITVVLESNYIKFHDAEKAYQQTIDDLRSEGLIKDKMKDGKGLHGILNDD